MKGISSRIDYIKKLGATGTWITPNGFDHALMNIYIDLPRKAGLKELPFKHALMPEAAEWNYLVSTAGFSNRLFSSEGASANNLVKSIGPTAFVYVDKNKKIISFLIAAESMNYPATPEGTKLYINTWDGDAGRLRELKPQGETWSFGGGSGSDPLIMGDCKLIQIRL